MPIRSRSLCAILLVASLLGGCREPESGPLTVSAIGRPPTLANPNRTALDAPAAILTAAAAQGLVRFDQGGQIEPALAQSWTVSDDGRSYIFRLARTTWPDGSDVKAEQVAERLRAAASRASRNRLKPVLGAMTEVLRMTDRVIEIRLIAPRPNFLQLLAQPEMAIMRAGQGTGPFAAEPADAGAIRLRVRDLDDEAAAAAAPTPDIMLRGERAALAVARFDAELAALVTGGTAADLPLARAAAAPAAALRFDPVNGLFGLTVASRTGLVGSADVRRALSMAIDRAALVAALGAPDVAPRASLLPGGIEEQPEPALPAWNADPLPARQSAARALIAAQGKGAEAPRIRVAMPDGPGAALIFAHLRRDWRAIGIEADRVAATEPADLRFLDEVAPAAIASWYLRRFTCDASLVCDPQADLALETARNTASYPERRQSLATADRILTDAVPFIPLAAPVRWLLVSPRLTGFQPNPFGSHFIGGLVAARR
jgi:peptide/nickel transport system substrate-binding protein